MYSYPGAPACPVPWRAVSPLPNAATPRPMLSGKPTSPQAGVNATEPTDPYRQGMADWRGLQSWLASQIGDRRAGADYWAANRSVPHHLPCASDATIGDDEAAFIAGCEDTKRRLDPIDARRGSDPQYRSGFSDAAKTLPIPSTIDAPKPQVPESAAVAAPNPPYRCRDPNTNFVYERAQPCATGDLTLSGPPISSSSKYFAKAVRPGRG